MTKIQELVDKVTTEYRTESVITDLSKTGDFNRFSDESKKTIQNLRKIALFELGEVSKKIQCPSCAKYWPEGLLFCTCELCFMHSSEQKRKIKSQFEILSIPHHIVKTDYPRGARHSSATWQNDHWKAINTKRNALKKDHKSITDRLLEDELYRNSQIPAG